MTGGQHHGRSNHARTTRVQHHGPSNHIGTTGAQHHGPAYHASTTDTGTTKIDTTGVADCDELFTKNGVPTTLPQLPNGVGISGGALIDRKSGRADSNLQKSNDLAGAERRPLHARVGRQSRNTLQLI
jgi:hypothetical protein